MSFHFSHGEDKEVSHTCSSPFRSMMRVEARCKDKRSSTLDMQYVVGLFCTRCTTPKESKQREQANITRSGTRGDGTESDKGSLLSRNKRSFLQWHSRQTTSSARSVSEKSYRSFLPDESFAGRAKLPRLSTDPSAYDERTRWENGSPQQRHTYEGCTYTS